MVYERPSPRSLQRIVEEILQFPITGILLGGSRSSSGDARPGSAEDAAPLGVFRARNQQRPVSAGFRSAGVQSNKADFVLLLSGLSWVNPAVERFLHHSKVETTLRRSGPCPCRRRDASPALRGVCCCWWMQSVSVPCIQHQQCNIRQKVLTGCFYISSFRPLDTDAKGSPCRLIQSSFILTGKPKIRCYFIVCLE